MPSSQGSYGFQKVLEFCYHGILQDKKVWEEGHWSRIVWKSVKTQQKNLKCMEGSKKNLHWDIGSVGVNVNFRALEKSNLSRGKVMEICFWKRVRTLSSSFGSTMERANHTLLRYYYFGSCINSVRTMPTLGGNGVQSKFQTNVCCALVVFHLSLSPILVLVHLMAWGMLKGTVFTHDSSWSTPSLGQDSDVKSPVQQIRTCILFLLSTSCFP